MPHPHKSIVIEDRSSIGEARRAAAYAAYTLGFDEGRRNDIAIVATEAATNVLMHAQSGEFLICPFLEGGTIWLDLFALDSGPGIRDIPRAMEDGYSTMGTAGQGLGAIGRLSDQSSLYSIAGKGTVYWSRFCAGETTPSMSLGLVNIPVHGEKTCGDSYLALLGATHSLYMVVDGLGHGVGATEAAEEAVSAVSRFRDKPPSEIIALSHECLKKTRGAAISVAIVDHERQTLTCAGVGNIGGMIVNSSGYRSMASQNGTLGAVIPRTIQTYCYPIDGNSTLIMFSDGLSTKSGTSTYPGIQIRHPAVAAGLLYRDFGRKRDDATVLVAPIGGNRA